MMTVERNRNNPLFEFNKNIKTESVTELSIRIPGDTDDGSKFITRFLP